MIKSLLILTLIGCASIQAVAQSDIGKIGFYNIENLFDTTDDPKKNDNEFLPGSNRHWDASKYNEKISHVNQVLDSLETPIITGFCEIENKTVVQDIIDNGSMKESHAVVHFESLDQRGIDNAIIYNKQLFNLNSSGIIRFDMPSPSSPSRDIVWAKLHLKSSDDTVLVMVNHWPSRRGGQFESEPKRLIAANAAKSFIDSVQTDSPDVKIVFMGDLNDHPEDMCPSLISESLTPMITEKSGVFGGSHSYRGHWGVLDHIFVSSNFLKKDKKGISVKKKSGTIYSAEFMLDEYKGNIVPFRTYGGRKYLGGYSDHLPVTVDIALPK